MSKFKISIEEPKKDFEIHLAHEGNNRILFSAPFGTGKTYFLKDFFKDTSKYEVVHLYPVNYSVASNEDIFELIKHDVLFELLQKDVDIDNTEFSDLFIAQNFLYEHPIDIIKPFIENTSELGKSIVPIFDSLKKLQNKYKLFKEQVNKNDTLSAFQYLKSFQGKKGSVYEQDFYTQLIRNLVLQLNAKGKETILIIDDLDRIDPEHIFRLLNVFAAHFDHNYSENKFGFSKIIFVTDVANLKSIFATKYGEKTDFSGYLNKFFSLNVFVFDNLKAIVESIDNYYMSIIPFDNETGNNFEFRNTENIESRIIKYLVRILIQNGKITMRSLVKLEGKKFVFKNHKIKGVFVDKFFLKKSTFIIIPVLDFISHLFGSSIMMERAFLDCKYEGILELNESTKDYSFLEAILIILDVRNTKLNDSHPNNVVYNNSEGFHKFSINYDLQNRGVSKVSCFINSIVFLDKSNQNEKEGIIQYFDLLYKTLKILQSDFDLFKS
jgi:hypothetical protein